MKKRMFSMVVALGLGLATTNGFAANCENWSAPSGHYYKSDGRGGCTLQKNAALPEKSCTTWDAPDGYRYVKVPGTTNSCTLEKQGSSGRSSGKSHP